MDTSRQAHIHIARGAWATPMIGRVRPDSIVPEESEDDDDGEIIRMIELNGMIALDADAYLADAS